MLEAFSELSHDGLHEQRQAAWNYAVRNPAAEGGVWGQFWGTAQFGAVGAPLTAHHIPQVGGLLVYNNVTWRVLHRQEGAVLLITEHVFGHGTRYNTPENIYTRLSYSHLRGALDTWAQNNLGTLRRQALMPIGVDGDVRSAPGDWDSTENAAAGFTSLGARTDSDAAVFVLSISEANQYFGPAGVNGNAPENNEARVARDTNGSERTWWLRSPGTTAHPAANVLPSGSISVGGATGGSTGFRPALWISV